MPTSLKRATPRRSDALVLAVAPICELPGLAVVVSWSEELAARSPLASPGTQIALLACLAVIVVAVVLSWRAHPGRPVPRAMPSLLWVVTGALGALTFWFFTPGVALMMAILLAHSTFSTAMLATRIARQGHQR